jgi:hypothetical protein
MATYVRAGLPEVATALAALTREDHPLAISGPSRGLPIPSNLPCYDRRGSDTRDYPRKEER